MKTPFYVFASVLFAILLNSCSNEKEEPVINKEQMSADYSQLIATAQPYISSGMQGLINKLDTATTALPIEAVLPYAEQLLTQDTLIHSQSATTRINDDGTTTQNGYSSTTTLFSYKAVTLSNYMTSPFRQSLGYSFDLSSTSKTVYLTCFAVCNYMYFPESISFAPAYTDGDLMGMHPDYFSSEITNNSTFALGYHCDEKAVGKLYYFTTYVFRLTETSVSSDGGRILPTTLTSLEDLEQFCNRLEWRYYAL